mgnify:CR=1 FL=1
MKQINFRKNEKITVGLILLLLCIFLAVLVPALSPWTSTEMHADIRSQGMSFSHPSGQISLEGICLYGFGAESGSVCVSDLQVHF